MFRLDGKKAVITGASGDLGFAMARALHDAGASIAVLDISPKTPELAGELAGDAPGSAFGILTDLSDRRASAAAFEEAAGRLGGVDILLNCAGINVRSPAEAYAAADWDRIIELNLGATFFLCQLAGRRMIPEGHGKIINIASMTSFTGGLNNCAYAASKGGVSQLTKTLSNEWARYGVCVNAIAPGYMWTRMNQSYYTDGEGRKIREEITARIPKGRWGRPEDLMGAAVFLSSEASDYVTGLILPVDGGFLGR